MGGSSEAPVCVASTRSRGRVANFRVTHCPDRVTTDLLIDRSAIAFDVAAVTLAPSKTQLRESAVSMTESPYYLQTVGANELVLRARRSPQVLTSARRARLELMAVSSLPLPARRSSVRWYPKEWLVRLKTWKTNSTPASGAVSVAVASGHYTADELIAAGGNYVLTSLEDEFPGLCAEVQW